MYNHKTVLVTGSSSGIGLSIAKEFYVQGANLVLNARNEEKLNHAAESFVNAGRIALVPGDIGDKLTGHKMVTTAIHRFGSVDVLVNNAGIFGIKPFLEKYRRRP